MKLTKEEAREIVWGCDSNFKVIQDNIIDNSRWSIIHSGIFQHVETGKYYKLNWSVGATESQDEKPFEYTDPDPVEVFPVQKTITVYEPAKQ